MPKPEWGVKRVCPTTGKRFYDLNKSPIVSPYTGEVIDIDNARRKSVTTVSRATADKDEETLVEDIDNDDDLLTNETSNDDDMDDDLLEDDEDDTVSLDDLADVPDEEE
ncbi:TIGR02300 family protein [Solirhodobacter olei]|uniref:TIGR02300 family protein n=1 Tax=Solirhodobacter olei TaxID=2493082 RepID=UPI000FDCD20D|nr:TIGR02300 family protein [Solirhodobacter olei]